MMDILNFRVKNGEYTVEYAGLDTVRIKSSDRPKAELFQALNLLIRAAEILFGFPFSQTGFSSIAISHGDAPVSRLVLEIPVPENDPAKLQCPAVDRGNVLHFETGEYLQDDPRNVYNKCVTKVEEAVKDYVQGKRQQMSFEFSADEADAMAEALGVDDPEVKKIATWQRQRAKEAVAADRILPFGKTEAAT
jgi:hypothetical protein